MCLSLFFGKCAGCQIPGCGDKRCWLRVWVGVWEESMAGVTVVWWWVVGWGSCVAPTYELTGCSRYIGPRHMHFFVAVDQAAVPVEPLQFHTGWRQAKEAHAAID